MCLTDKSTGSCDLATPANLRQPIVLHDESERSDWLPYGNCKRDETGRTDWVYVPWEASVKPEGLLEGLTRM